ncbi:MAG: hypothetical protein PHS60_14155, partial [Zavarzinia sp.]|nr:hypothetical protein [Zavarzinia sp.]
MTRKTLGRPLDDCQLDKVIGGQGELTTGDHELEQFKITPEMLDTLGQFEDGELVKAYQEGLEDPRSTAFADILATAGFGDPSGIIEGLGKDFGSVGSPEEFKNLLLGALKDASIPAGTGETATGAETGGDTPASFEPAGGFGATTSDDWGASAKDETTEPAPPEAGPFTADGDTGPGTDTGDGLNGGGTDDPGDDDPGISGSGTFEFGDVWDPNYEPGTWNNMFDSTDPAQKKAWDMNGGWLKTDTGSLIYKDPQCTRGTEGESWSGTSFWQEGDPESGRPAMGFILHEDTLNDIGGDVEATMGDKMDQYLRDVFGSGGETKEDTKGGETGGSTGMTYDEGVGTIPVEEFGTLFRQRLGGDGPLIRVMGGEDGQIAVSETEYEQFLYRLNGGLVSLTDGASTGFEGSVAFATSPNPAVVNVAPELDGNQGGDTVVN